MDSNSNYPIVFEFYSLLIYDTWSGAITEQQRKHWKSHSEDVYIIN